MKLMITAFSMFLPLFKIWWREFTTFIFLNVIWLLLQFLIITGPPSTALMYTVARVAINDDLIEFSTLWKSFKSLFIPAWKWGLINLAIFGIVFINFNFYQNYTGFFWSVLRAAWGMMIILWTCVNLLYWPLWILQEDRSIRTTLRNGFVLLLRKPAMVIFMAGLSLLLTVVSFLTSLPLVLFMMSWLAVYGTLIVDEALKDMPRTG
jgi:uncharacterized membrane protein YesL